MLSVHIIRQRNRKQSQKHSEMPLLSDLFDKTPGYVEITFLKERYTDIPGVTFRPGRWTIVEGKSDARTMLILCRDVEEHIEKHVYDSSQVFRHKNHILLDYLTF